MIAPQTDYQTRVTSPVAGIVSTAKELASDLVELTELQIQLAKSDGNELIRKSIPSILGLILGATLALSATEMILHGLANLLADQRHLPIGTAQLIVGAVVVGTAALVMSIAVIKLRVALTTFKTSTAQLVKNLDWLKSMIRSGSQN